MSVGHGPRHPRASESDALEDAFGGPVLPEGRGSESVVGDCAWYRDGRRRGPRLALPDAAAAARQGDGFVWVGLRHPTDDDIAEVAAEFGLPALAVEDAVHAHQRPKLEVYGEVVFVVLKPARYVDHVEVVDIAELAFFLGPTFVVTVRHGECDTLLRVRAELEEGLSDPYAGFGQVAVLHRAADLVADGYEQALELINEDVDEIEALVFGPGADDHAERIYKLKSEVAELRRAVLPLIRPLERLAAGGVPHVPDVADQYFRDVHDHVMRAAEGVELVDRQLSDVLQANTARVTTGQSKVALRQNEDMRKISAWAAIALVPTAIAGIYGMNFDHMPELRWRYGYFVVLAVIAATCTGLHRLFRRNGWL
ncbi:magnesium and cobalt transport protein CorA [Cellulomonas soli]|uniref:Magnesium transport protein CorA n=1 Tax=Cellulomonas soli TaxID=931535 RepID=A0A512PH44_9CELL|nr:magnesium and cobalt transport protein CorA [Cellulomonas soli]NYI59658.1 magnesium transporter [Cellulomonas soli]GEP70452.1 magnesium transport protein CorA [Cellulomonas soli]